MKTVKISFLMVLVLSAISVSISADQKEGLILYFIFDDDTDIVKDQSGNGNNGKIGPGSPEYIDGKFGKALNFNGDGTCINVQDSPILSPLKELSVAVWVKPKAAPVALRVVASHLPGWSIQTHGDEATMRRCYVSLNEMEVGCGKKALSTGQWMHLAFTFDGRTLKFYYNGMLDGEFPIQLQSLNDGKLPLIIGKSDSDANSWLGGIDEVKVWNRALRDEEVSESVNPIGKIAVEVIGKLVISWARLKVYYHMEDN